MIERGFFPFRLERGDLLLVEGGLQFFDAGGDAV